MPCSHFLRQLPGSCLEQFSPTLHTRSLIAISFSRVLLKASVGKIVRINLHLRRPSTSGDNSAILRGQFIRFKERLSGRPTPALNSPPGAKPLLPAFNASRRNYRPVTSRPPRWPVFLTR